MHCSRCNFSAPRDQNNSVDLKEWFTYLNQLYRLSGPDEFNQICLASFRGLRKCARDILNGTLESKLCRLE